MKDTKLIGRGILSAFGVSIYVFLISLFINNASWLFGQEDNKFLIPIVMLLLFVFSALVTGSLILAKPIMLYLEGAKKGAVKLLFYTGASLFVFLLISIVILILIK
ncbi:MAG: hypothetical protein WC467_04765 [Patescibacteria group bacterium]